MQPIEKVLSCSVIELDEPAPAGCFCQNWKTPTLVPQFFNKRLCDNAIAELAGGWSRLIEAHEAELRTKAAEVGELCSLPEACYEKIYRRLTIYLSTLPMNHPNLLREIEGVNSPLPNFLLPKKPFTAESAALLMQLPAILGVETSRADSYNHITWKEELYSTHNLLSTSYAVCLRSLIPSGILLPNIIEVWNVSSEDSRKLFSTADDLFQEQMNALPEEKTLLRQRLLLVELFKALGKTDFFHISEATAEEMAKKFILTVYGAELRADETEQAELLLTYRLSVEPEQTRIATLIDSSPLVAALQMVSINALLSGMEVWRQRQPLFDRTTVRWLKVPPEISSPQLAERSVPSASSRPVIQFIASPEWFMSSMVTNHKKEPLRTPFVEDALLCDSSHCFAKAKVRWINRLEHPSLRSDSRGPLLSRSLTLCEETTLTPEAEQRAILHNKSK